MTFFKPIPIKYIDENKRKKLLVDYAVNNKACDDMFTIYVDQTKPGLLFYMIPRFKNESLGKKELTEHLYFVKDILNVKDKDVLYITLTGSCYIKTNKLADEQISSFSTLSSLLRSEDLLAAQCKEFFTTPLPEGADPFEYFKKLDYLNTSKKTKEFLISYNYYNLSSSEEHDKQIYRFVKEFMSIIHSICDNETEDSNKSYVNSKGIRTSNAIFYILKISLLKYKE